MGDDRLPDHYEILGVPQSAAPEDITRAYRQMLRIVHPDVSGTSGLFRLVKAAHDTLKDPRSRAAYDAARRLPDPQPDITRPEPPADRPPPPSAPPPRHAEATEEYRRKDDVGPASAVLRVRPRFGAHWTVVGVTVAWTVACLLGSYALWPATVPVGLLPLVALPVLAAPIISSQPTLRSRPWVWLTCVAPFAVVAALTGVDAPAHLAWPFGGALTGLAVGGTGLALAPYVVGRGRDLDALVSRESLEYQIFNVPGAGLREAAARETAQISAARLDDLAAMDAVRIVHGLTPPQLPGRARCHVEHVVLRDNRLAVVIVRRWPAATYAWTERGALTADGRRFPGDDTGIVPAVRAFRKIMPRGVRVRGYVSVLPDDPADAAGFRFLPAAGGEFFAGTPEQVRDSIGTWLGAGRPIVRRRAFATLLLYLRRP